MNRKRNKILGAALVFGALLLLSGCRCADGEHRFTETVLVPPGCTEEGLGERVCESCGLRTSFPIPPQGHRYRIENREEGDCTHPGWIEYLCADCGETYTETTEIRPDRHSFGEDNAQTVTEPGCETEGVLRVFCERCGAYEEETIPPLGHNLCEPTCTEDGFCIRCGEAGEPALGHENSEGFCVRCQRYLGREEDDFSYEENGDFDVDERAVMREMLNLVTADKHVAFVYWEPDTGRYFSVNGELRYRTQSTIKLAFCQYILEMGADLDETRILERVNMTSASGALTSAALGRSFSLRELIRLTLTYSDNQAYRMLVDRFGAGGFETYMKQNFGFTFGITDTSIFGRCTPMEMTRCMRHVYERNDPVMMDSLQKAVFKGLQSTKYRTAAKYGYCTDPDDSHAVALVFADPRPYLLTVFTNYDSFDREVFRKLPAMCDLLVSIHNP